jgi:hypothetical protein
MEFRKIDPWTWLALAATPIRLSIVCEAGRFGDLGCCDGGDLNNALGTLLKLSRS